MKKETIIPIIIQTLIWFGAAWQFASAQEHRFTVLEETLKMQVRITERLAEQVGVLQSQQQRILAIEEYVFSRFRREEK